MPPVRMAIPIVVGDRLLGVIYVESLTDLHFGYDEEDALVVFAAQLGLAMLHHQMTDEGMDETPDRRAFAGATAGRLDGAPLCRQRQRSLSTTIT